MELKKNPKFDLAPKAGLFRLIGLNITLVAVIIAFEIPGSGNADIIDLGVLDTDQVEIIEIPPTEQLPPPPPMTQQIDIREIPDEVVIEDQLLIELDVEVIEQTTVQDLVFVEAAPVEEDVDEIFTIVEEQPQFPGGMEAFYAFVSDRIRYPSAARRMHVEGRVFVQFVVDKGGDLTNIVVVKGVGAGLDEEAVRVMKMVPNFKPGKQRGKPVRVKMVVPIYFKLAQL
jgi:protein TonB